MFLRLFFFMYWLIWKGCITEMLCHWLSWYGILRTFLFSGFDVYKPWLCLTTYSKCKYKAPSDCSKSPFKICFLNHWSFLKSYHKKSALKTVLLVLKSHLTAKSGKKVKFPFLRCFANCFSSMGQNQLELCQLT